MFGRRRETQIIVTASISIVTICLIVLIGIGCGSDSARSGKEGVAQGDPMIMGVEPSKELKPEDVGYLRFKDMETACREAGLKVTEARLPAYTMEGEVEAIYVGTSTLGGKELAVHYTTGFAISQEPIPDSGPLDYEGLIDQTKELNEKGHNKNIKEQNTELYAEGQEELEPSQKTDQSYLTYLVEVAGHKGIVFPSQTENPQPSGSVYWNGEGFQYKVSAMDPIITIDQLLKIADSMY